ncbi:MAG: hypothetical protein JXQ76_10280 [Campylobacterales bacterium]|nr:hypothetical protein [Campylobacterales bacterium]
MLFRFFLFLSLFSLLEAAEVRNLLVVKATKSTIEAEDLLNTMQSRGMKSKIEKIKNYQLVTIELPKDDSEAVLLISSIKQNYPDAFRLYLPKIKDPNDEINIEQIANSLSGDKVSNIGFLANIPKKDLPVWGALLLLILIIIIVLIKSYMQRRDIDKLQKKLLVRQEKIAKSISEEKKTMQEKEKKLEKEGRK